ncbi:hypothetical protein M422DRAFT_784445 [Sphaerobolus stellatus SS14]|uniref:Uncharacterized protein n=1 Tax=Sphaerobolus stellatus (strain SS14) TaxID=990650 RepID=A0A0C9THB0_SPHS4|nr:hypothetical protein M422DRAFT_784445 [Sphaerobolus stellatus SS14]
MDYHSSSTLSQAHSLTSTHANNSSHSYDIDLLSESHNITGISMSCIAPENSQRQLLAVHPFTDTKSSQYYAGDTDILPIPPADGDQIVLSPQEERPTSNEANTGDPRLISYHDQSHAVGLSPQSNAHYNQPPDPSTSFDEHYIPHGPPLSAGLDRQQLHYPYSGPRYGNTPTGNNLHYQHATAQSGVPNQHPAVISNEIVNSPGTYYFPSPISTAPMRTGSSYASMAAGSTYGGLGSTTLAHEDEMISPRKSMYANFPDLTSPESTSSFTQESISSFTQESTSTFASPSSELHDVDGSTLRQAHSVGSESPSCKFVSLNPADKSYTCSCCLRTTKSKEINDHIYGKRRVFYCWSCFQHPFMYSELIEHEMAYVAGECRNAYWQDPANLPKHCIYRASQIEFICKCHTTFKDWKTAMRHALSKGDNAVKWVCLVCEQPKGGRRLFTRSDSAHAHMKKKHTRAYLDGFTKNA